MKKEICRVKTPSNRNTKTLDGGVDCEKEDTVILYLPVRVKMNF